MHFDMVTPCNNCPFRADITFYLSPERTQEILEALLVRDQTFSCHKTVSYDTWDKECDYLPTGQEQHCAGALIMAERQDRPNQMMRISERLGLYDRHKLTMEAPVFATPTAMLRRMQRLQRSIEKHGRTSPP